MVDVSYKQRQYHFNSENNNIRCGEGQNKRSVALRVCYFELQVLKSNRDYLPLPFLT